VSKSNNKSFDLYKASSGLVGQKILGYLFQAWCRACDVELKVVVTKTCNFVKLVELDA